MEAPLAVNWNKKRGEKTFTNCLTELNIFDVSGLIIIPSHFQRTLTIVISRNVCGLYALGPDLLSTRSSLISAGVVYVHTVLHYLLPVYLH